MRSMVEGAISVLAPSTPLRAVPFPRCAGEDLATQPDSTPLSLAIEADLLRSPGRAARLVYRIALI